MINDGGVLHGGIVTALLAIRAAVVPMPSEGRIRIYAGNFNLVSPWKERPVFTTRRDHAATELLFGLGGDEEPGPKLFSGLAVVNAPRVDLAPHAGCC